MTNTTCIRRCAWLIAWDQASLRHQYLRDVDITFAGNTIDFIGRHYEGTVDDEIDGRQLFVLPGLVNVHSHAALEPNYKGIREEHGVPEMYMTGLYERCASIMPDVEGQRAGVEVSYAELLLSGVTTLADLSHPFPGWLDLAARSGMRIYLAPWYASAVWYLENRHELKYRWDEAAGRRAFDDALRLIDEADAHPCGRLSGMIAPAQIDTCTEDLLRDSLAAARERSRPFTTHASQSVVEFETMVRRHGKTPIQWAHEIGLLGDHTILGHAIFIDQHSWLHWATRDDLSLLAETETAIAHCPTPFARYGQMLEHIGRYARAGVRVGIGTDTVPHNMLEEMRWATVLGKISAEDISAVTMEEVFRAATVGGATALVRDDIGRLAPGKKADLVLVDLQHPLMKPTRDPLRSLVFHGADRCIRDVYVDGIRVVEGGTVLTLDYEGAVDRVEEAQRRMIDETPSRDYAGRSVDDIAPLSIRMGGGA